MTAYLVAGTQSERGKQNHVIVMKMSQLRKTGEENEGEGGIREEGTEGGREGERTEGERREGGRED